MLCHPHTDPDITIPLVPVSNAVCVLLTDQALKARYCSSLQTIIKPALGVRA